MNMFRDDLGADVWLNVLPSSSRNTAKEKEAEKEKQLRRASREMVVKAQNRAKVRALEAKFRRSTYWACFATARPFLLCGPLLSCFMATQILKVK